MEPRLSSLLEAPTAPSYVEVEELGVFGAMALLGMLQAGADPGFHHLRRLAGRGARLAPHEDLRQRILMALLETGVLAPAGPRRLRLDATLADPDRDRSELEEADWAIRWSDTTRGSLVMILRSFLDELDPTPRNLEILLDAWFALAKAECLAFGARAGRARSARRPVVINVLILTRANFGSRPPTDGEGSGVPTLALALALAGRSFFDAGRTSASEHPRFQPRGAHFRRMPGAQAVRRRALGRRPGLPLTLDLLSARC